MKKICLFVIFVLCASFVTAELEILPVEEPAIEVIEPVVAPVKHSTGGSFYLKQGKSLFGLKSKEAGFGFGIPIRSISPKRDVKINFGGATQGKIQSLTIKSPIKQNGLRFVHLKSVPSNSLLKFELLSTLSPDTKYVVEFKLPRDDSRTIEGAVKLPKKSSNWDYYQMTLPKAGVIEVVASAQAKV